LVALMVWAYSHSRPTIMKSSSWILVWTGTGCCQWKSWAGHQNWRVRPIGISVANAHL